jgi:hypothetical protein
MGWLRCGDGGAFVRRFDGIDYWGDEAVAAFGKGLNVAWVTGVVAEELAKLKHVGAQNLWLDIGFRPEFIQELVVSDQASGVLDQVTQNRERLGRKSHRDAVVDQTFVPCIEPERPKLLHSDRTSG